MLPAFIILKSNNELMFVDKLGGLRTTSSKLDSIVKIAKIEKLRRVKENNLSIIESHSIVDKNGKPIYTSHIRKIKFLEKTNEYILNYDYGKEIYKLDSNGKIIYTYNLDEMLKNHNKIGVNIIHFVFDEDSAELAMNINTGGVEQHLFLYNTLNEQSYLKPISNLRDSEKGIKPALDIGYSSINKNFFLNLDYKGFLKKNNGLSEPQLYIIDITNELDSTKSYINYLPSIRKNNDIWGFNYTFSLIVNGKIYCTNMLSTELYEFNLDGVFIKKYEMPLSKFYRFNPIPMESTKANEYRFFRGRASINEDILFDSYNDKKYIYFQNMDFVDSSNVKLSRRVPTKHYLIELKENNEIFFLEIELPKNHVPFHIYRNEIFTTTNEDGLKIHKLKIN